MILTNADALTLIESIWGVMVGVEGVFIFRAGCFCLCEAPSSTG